MGALISLVIVLVLLFLPIAGIQVAGMYGLFGVFVPYVAFLIFGLGIIYRVSRWAMSPVPFRIPTTCGQQKSLPWIKSNNLECPHNIWGVLGRMTLEVLFFRSLFRNTKTEVRDGPKVIHGSEKWLWLGAMAFHWTFVLVFLRHLRFFIEPVPSFVLFLQAVDGFFQIGVPVLYATSVIFLVAVSYLLFRRIFSAQVRYISLASDYFPLLLILGIGTTGFLLRHFLKTDVVGVKELGMGLITFQPMAEPERIHVLFYSHFFLVCILFAYFPFSKLVHAAGVFLSPTRNLASNNRMRRHINPWNYPVKVHTYAEYEAEFGEKMRNAGLPVEKE